MVIDTLRQNLETLYFPLEFVDAIQGFKDAVSIIRKLLMLPAKMLRSVFTLLFTCLIILNCFTRPAFAGTDGPVDSLINGFWYGVGGVIGGATGTLATCYAVNVLIAPVAPPVAAYLAGFCPAIGGTVGALGGAAGVNAVIRAPHSTPFTYSHSHG